MKKIIAAFFVTTLVMVFSTAGTDGKLHVKTNSKTSWWIGVINKGSLMPFKDTDELEMNLFAHPDGNQVNPLLLSNQGDVIWCDYPPKVFFKDEEIVVDAKGTAIHTKAGSTLKQAYKFASKNYFPPSGKTPDMHLVSAPQYNTWIELMYDQNQKDILKYANNIIKNGYPPGVLMIDDNWQEDYGKWNFHEGRFHNPKMMMDSLHGMGFKVMLWVCPFVSPDCDVYRDLDEKGCFMKNDQGQSAMVRWWNGVSAELDLSNPKAMEWFKGELNKLISEYHVDGFKFDAGDAIFYKGLKSFKPMIPDEHTVLWGKIGLDYPLNEYRAMFKMGGQPLVERLRDKAHLWEDLQKLIPNMLLQGINGYVFGCPDMIGGGESASFLHGAVIDQEMIIRSAQIHALMPMMQFSVAPWRILDDKHRDAMKKTVATRMKFNDYIGRLIKEAAETNEPVVRYLEYSFPHQGYSEIKDEFMLGDSVLVAPVVEKNKNTKTLILPKGTWKYVSGKKYKGGREITVEAPVDVLPYFIKVM